MTIVESRFITILQIKSLGSFIFTSKWFRKNLPQSDNYYVSISAEFISRNHFVITSIRVFVCPAYIQRTISCPRKRPFVTLAFILWAPHGKNRVVVAVRNTCREEKREPIIMRFQTKPMLNALAAGVSKKLF